jgi:hypothetical protein
MATVTPTQYPRATVEAVGMTITADHDITADTIVVTILDRDVESPDPADPAITWHAPDLDETSTDGRTRTVRILMGPTADGGTIDVGPGSWRVWVRAIDTLERPLLKTADYFKVV